MGPSYFGEIVDLSKHKESAKHEKFSSFIRLSESAVVRVGALVVCPDRFPCLVLVQVKVAWSVREHETL